MDQVANGSFDGTGDLPVAPAVTVPVDMAGDKQIVPPAPPGPYVLPAAALSVANVEQLQAALDGQTRDFILEDGDYDNGSYLSIGSHRLWARNLGA